MDHTSRGQVIGHMYVLVRISQYYPAAGRGRFYEKLRHWPEGVRQGHEGGPLGECLTPLAGPMQKRSNHTGKEDGKRGAIWQAFPRPLLVASTDGARYRPGHVSIKDQGATISYTLQYTVLWCTPVHGKYLDVLL